MARHSVLQAFYASDVWRDFRMRLIGERGLRCEHCGKLVTQSRKLTAHHKIELTPDNVHDATISLNPDNVILVHHSCHNEIHKRFGGAQKRSVYLVYGPPLAGKTSFVRD
ncbi:HNH endonuclease, partial [Mycobacterium tuberculosis]|uniref:HNH endonuclease n=1 Tax=Mycobacterium tuberculosis TaxID=1773 RepID=UPI0004F2E085